MDQGNKRTPQRFVGREAVVTTQCLNGWLVILHFFLPSISHKFKGFDQLLKVDFDVMIK